jgi:hypothetical protein
VTAGGGPAERQRTATDRTIVAPPVNAARTVRAPRPTRVARDGRNAIVAVPGPTETLRRASVLRGAATRASVRVTRHAGRHVTATRTPRPRSDRAAIRVGARTARVSGAAAVVPAGAGAVGVAGAAAGAAPPAVAAAVAVAPSTGIGAIGAAPSAGAPEDAPPGGVVPVPVPAPGGVPVGGGVAGAGASRATTSAVGADSAWAVPNWFVAVTRARSVAPTSASVAV